MRITSAHAPPPLSPPSTFHFGKDCIQVVALEVFPSMRKKPRSQKRSRTKTCSNPRPNTRAHFCWAHALGPMLGALHSTSVTVPIPVFCPRLLCVWTCMWSCCSGSAAACVSPRSYATCRNTARVAIIFLTRKTCDFTRQERQNAYPIPLHPAAAVVALGWCNNRDALWI